jgi:prepilin-type N-terminal cleavage/methylation domain-containing protein
MYSRKAFTLIELLVVIAIIAILAVVVVLTLNPAALFQQSRDSNRLSDMQTLTSAINLYNSDQGGTPGYSLGTPGVIYISVPDPTATTTAGTNCSGLGLFGNYHCAASSTYRNANGTGWIPIDFASTTTGSPLSVLPVDPVNTTSSGEYYQYMTDGNTFEIAGIPESQKYSTDPANFAAGSSRTLITLGVTYTTSTYATEATGNYDIAFDSHTNTIWAASTGNLLTQISDTAPYTSSTFTLGPSGSEHQFIVFDPHTNTIWTTNYSVGSVSQMNDTAPYTSSTYAIGGYPTGIAFDSRTNTIWVTDAIYSGVTMINDTTYASTTYGINAVAGVAFDSHTNTIWAASVGNTVTQISDTTPYATSAYAVGSAPYGVAFDSHTNTIWVVNQNSSTVTQISDTAPFATSTYAVGSCPDKLAFDSHTNSIWVANGCSGTVTQISDTAPYATSTYAANSPYSIAFDSHTNAIWVTSIGNLLTQFIPNH